ncbi:acyltransferase family protein [Micrococcales bacterium 31B]|nr:acyltransferase family protein [Micrococcales bacterium 31B]
MRLDIQGLRAVAVLAVVIFHAQSHWLPGGFIGVDIFFVISGFLMTGLLRRDLSGGKPHALRDFFIKRLRRLFPAAAVVVLVTLVAMYIWAPVTRAREFGFDAISSLFYVANIRFSLSNTGYFANDVPSPYLHLWSLSVEEQFYIVLALLLLALRKASQRVVATVLSVLLVISLVTSIALSTLQPDFSYYNLPTRGWEFMIGSLVSLGVPYWRRLTPDAVVATRWLGAALIVLSLIITNETMPFPGWIAAVPTVGTALVIVAGCRTEAWARHVKHRVDPVLWLLECRPMKYVGDISYSFYLWHWPALIVPLIALGTDLTVWQSLAGVAVAFVLAVITYYFVEQKLRIHKGVKFSVLRTTAVSLAAALAMSALSAGAMVHAQSQIDRATQLLAGTDKSSGEGTDTPLGNTDFPPAPVLTPALDKVGTLSDPLQAQCLQGYGSAEIVVCTYQPPTPPTKHVVMYGDSQMDMLWPTVKAVAVQEGWQLDMIAKGGCPPAVLPSFPGRDASLIQTCPVWQKASVAKLAELKPDLLITTGFADPLLHQIWTTDQAFNTNWTNALAAYDAQLPQGMEKLYITARPTLFYDPFTCLSQNLDDPASCDHPLKDFITGGLVEAEEKALAPLGYKFWSINDIICPEGICSPVQKNYVVFKDGLHVTDAFARAIAPLAWGPLTAAMNGEAIPPLPTGSGSTPAASTPAASTPATSGVASQTVTNPPTTSATAPAPPAATTPTSTSTTPAPVEAPVPDPASADPSTATLTPSAEEPTSFTPSAKTITPR